MRGEGQEEWPGLRAGLQGPAGHVWGTARRSRWSGMT